MVFNFFLLSGSTPDLGQFPFKYIPLKPSKYSWSLLCTLYDNILNIFELFCFTGQLNHKIKVQIILFPPTQKSQLCFIRPARGLCCSYQSVKHYTSILHQSAILCKLNLQNKDEFCIHVNLNLLYYIISSHKEPHRMAPSTIYIGIDLLSKYKYSRKVICY